MKKTILCLILGAAGLVLMALSVITGEARVALVLFIPVIYGGVLLFISVLLLMSSFLLWIFLPSADKVREVKGESKYGGVVFIGPIPIILGSDKNVTRTMLYIGLVIALLLFFTYAFIIFY